MHMKPAFAFAAVLSLVSVVAVVTPAADAPPASAPASAPDPAVNDLLLRLDARGKDLTDLQTSLVRTTTDAMVGDTTSRTGTLWLKRTPADGDTIARILLDEHQVGNQQMKEKIEYQYEKGVLTERDYPKRKQIRRQYGGPDQKMDPLKLGGPIPLPIGQDPKEVNRLFVAKLIKPAGDDPKGTEHLQLIPRHGTKFSQKFEKLDVWVDPAINLPVRLEIDNTKAGTIERWDLTNVKVNSGLNAAELSLPPLPSPQSWTLRDEALSD